MKQDLIKQLQHIEQLMNNGDMNDALEMLDELSKKHPDNYYIASMLGECFLSLGKPQKAIKPLKWAAKKFPKEEAVEQKQDDEEMAISQIRKKMGEKKKNNLWVDHYLLGCAYGRCMKFRSAVRHLNIADKMSPNNAEVIRNLGWIRCMQEKKDNGRKLLRQAIKLDPDNALAYNDLGASYMFDEKLDEAKKWIEKALSLDPHDTFIHNTADKLEELMALKTLFGKIPKK